VDSFCPPTRVGIEGNRLFAQTLTYLAAARAPLVQKAYNREFGIYLRWMAANNITDLWSDPGEPVLCMYTTWMVHVKLLKPSTAKQYLTNINTCIQDRGHRSVLLSSAGVRLRDLHLLWLSLKKAFGDSVKHKMAVSCDMVRAAAGWSGFLGFDGGMLWAAVTLAATMGLRVSEFTSPTTRTCSPSKTLVWSDLEWGVTAEGWQYVIVTIKNAKNDPFRAGYRHHLWHDGSTMCPYTAMLTHYQSTAASRHGAVGPLFRYASGTNLTRGPFTKALRASLQFAGYNPGLFSAHSLRAGAAVSVSTAGYSGDVIQKQGRWKSSAYADYLAFGLGFLRRVQMGMTAVTTEGRVSRTGEEGATAAWTDAPWAA
jgi:hypothetical protein